MDFWLGDPDVDDALYLGKMIVARSHAGRQLGDAIMNWAGEVAHHAGRRWLRLDCRRDNHGLHRYYKDRGFTHLRTVTPDHHVRRTESGRCSSDPPR